MGATEGTGDNTGWVGGSLQEVTETLFSLMRANPFYLSEQTEGYYEEGTGWVPLQIDQGWLHVQNILNPFVLFLATLGILFAAIRLLWQRRLDPMMDLIRGLLTVIVTTFAGIFIVTVLVGLSRALTGMVLQFNLSDEEFQATVGGDEEPEDLLTVAAQVYPSVLRAAMNEQATDAGFAGPLAQGAITEMVGLAVMVGLTVQIVVMALLQAIIYLIVCVLPLAAASTMVPGLKIFTKLVGWLLACLLYKPLILLIYLAGLVLLGINTGDNPLFRYLLAAAVMLLATGALPVLMKLMSSPGVWALALGSSFIGGGSGGSGSGAAAGGASGEGASQDTAGAGQDSSVTTASAPSGEGTGSEPANNRADDVAGNLGAAEFGDGTGSTNTAGLSGEGTAIATSGGGSLPGGGDGAALTSTGGASGSAGGYGSTSAAESATVAAGSDDAAASGYESAVSEGAAASGAAETGGEFTAASASGPPGADGIDTGALPESGGDAPTASGAPSPISGPDFGPSGAREA
ncbi:hypothetical protein [Nocardiopsis coralliicola]